jgi:hypothetical protein
MVGGWVFVSSLLPAATAAQSPVDPTGACLLLDFKALLSNRRDRLEKHMLRIFACDDKKKII